MITLVLDHLWQSTLFAVAAGFLTLALDRNSARICYWLWFTASIKFLIPFLLLTGAGASLAAHLAPVAQTLPVFPSALIVNLTQPFSAKAPVLLAPVVRPLWLSFALLIVWALGFAGVLGFWLARWSELPRTCRTPPSRASRRPTSTSAAPTT